MGSRIKFGRVLALKKDGKFTVGAPYLSEASVEAEVLEQLRGEKLIVYKMKPKKHYRRKNGHRCGGGLFFCAGGIADCQPLLKGAC